MKNIGAAIFLAQRILGGAGVENKDSLVLRRVGQREKRRRREVGKNEGDAFRGKAVQRRRRVVARLQANILYAERLAEKTSRCVVVLGGKLGTSDPIVGGRNVEDREGLLRVRGANEPCLDVDAGRGVGRKRARREHKQARGHQGSSNSCSCPSESCGRPAKALRMANIACSSGVFAMSTSWILASKSGAAASCEMHT